tara:strand:+ start:29 stop:211 length:183 start_codon:yes stop_codon:yes gene_type:complete
MNFIKKHPIYSALILLIVIIISFVIIVFTMFASPLINELKEECLKKPESERLSKDCTDVF